MADDAPSDTAAPASGIGALTAREAEILSKAWTCLKSGPPEIDYEKLAAETGMTNPRSASNSWSAIKKKMAWATAPAAGAGAKSTPGKKSAAAGKRKKAAPVVAADDDDDEDDESPAKKAKATPASRKKSAPVVKEADEEGADENKVKGEAHEQDAMLQEGQDLDAV